MTTIFDDINAELYNQLPFNYRYAKKSDFKKVTKKEKILVIKVYNTSKAVPRRFSKPISRVTKKTI
jgi:hypothetical protein